LRAVAATVSLNRQVGKPARYPKLSLPSETLRDVNGRIAPWAKPSQADGGIFSLRILSNRVNIDSKQVFGGNKEQ